MLMVPEGTLRGPPGLGPHSPHPRAALHSHLPEQDDGVGRQQALGGRSLGSGGEGGRGEVGEYLAGFLLCCDAMVMPRRMGEGGREKKGNGEENSRMEEQGQVEMWMRGGALLMPPGRVRSRARLADCLALAWFG